VLRLFVMRHAKSSWAQPGSRDFDRDLNERGVLDMERLRNFVDKRKINPEVIYCSSAERTRHSLDKFLDCIDPAPVVHYTEKLYSSGVDEYLSIIHETQEPVSLMLVGHNPMCGNLAAKSKSMKALWWMSSPLQNFNHLRPSLTVG